MFKTLRLCTAFILSVSLVSNLVVIPVQAQTSDSENTNIGASVPNDIDGDGMPNDWELDHGLDPADPSDAGLDNDSDGLVNLEEYNRNTDPNDPDTDDGGLNDGDEVDQGKDPLDPSDDDAAVISNIQVTNITETSAIIAWQTDVLADSLIGYSSTTGNYSNEVYDPSLVTNHSITLTGLSPGIKYYFRVISDESGGATAQSVNDSIQNFTTLSDSTPPSIANVSVNPSSTTAIITWTTNEPATSQVNYGFTTSYGSNSDLYNSLVTGHSVAFSNLSPNTTYHFRVRSSDANGNESISVDFTFTTGAPAPDITPPGISNITITQLTTNSVVITLDTNEDARGYVAYGYDTGYGVGNTSDALTPLGQSHTITLQNLLANTTYHFKVYAIDSRGNLGESQDQAFTTLLSPSTSTAPQATTGPVRPSQLPEWFRERYDIVSDFDDPDGDGLTNYEEYIEGTDPLRSDTDYDGLNDYDEVRVYHTNPNLKDTDYDGLTDLDEVVIYKTDPTVWDTDEGSVSDGDEVLNGTNPLDPTDDLRVVIGIYPGDQPSDILSLLGKNFVEAIIDIDLTVEMQRPEGAIGLIVNYNGSTYFSEEDFIKATLKSPTKAGLYELRIQVLMPDSKTTVIRRFIEVKPQGIVEAHFWGLFAPLYRLIPYFKNNELAGVSVSLYRYDEEQQQWHYYNTARYGARNPQNTDINGGYGFIIEPGLYRAIYQRDDIGVREVVFTQEDSVIFNGSVFFEVNGDWAFWIILGMLVLAAITWVFIRR